MAESGGLHGLAEAWESYVELRQRARRLGQLLEWPNPKTVGVPTMFLGILVASRVSAHSKETTQLQN